MLRTFLGAGHVEIDTARMYMSGETESCIGAIFDEEPALQRLKTSTKANAFQGYDRASTGIYYLHNPDGATPILETLEAVDALHKAGAFEELGLSNFAAWEVAHIYHLCAAKGFVKPSVYQGMYNGLTRDVERELLPCLRARHAILRLQSALRRVARLQAHARVLADLDDGLRFRKDNTMYRERYLQDVQLAAVDAFQAACDASATPPVHAALRWMSHHSKLAPGDGIIIGASKVAHLEDNLAGLGGGPLDDGVVASLDAGWAAVKASGLCPSYERGTSCSRRPCLLLEELAALPERRARVGGRGGGVAAAFPPPAASLGAAPRRSSPAAAATRSGADRPAGRWKKFAIFAPSGDAAFFAGGAGGVGGRGSNGAPSSLLLEASSGAAASTARSAWASAAASSAASARGTPPPPATAHRTSRRSAPPTSTVA
ncbi:phenanthrene-epoxide hydrolase [Aureococcus anophagefferens]|nr:phenanthrene-epoxide hydrolase [Aureococcus anophagefferens]